MSISANRIKVCAFVVTLKALRYKSASTTSQCNYVIWFNVKVEFRIKLWDYTERVSSSHVY